jgi:hypothetical protein
VAIDDVGGRGQRGLLGILARLTVADDATAIVAQLDDVTAPLAGLGEQATRLRTEIGLDDVGAQIGLPR